MSNFLPQYQSKHLFFSLLSTLSRPGKVGQIFKGPIFTNIFCETFDFWKANLLLLTHWLAYSLKGQPAGVRNMSQYFYSNEEMGHNKFKGFLASCVCVGYMKRSQSFIFSLDIFNTNLLILTVSKNMWNFPIFSPFINLSLWCCAVSDENISRR